MPRVSSYLFGGSLVVHVHWTGDFCPRAKNAKIFPLMFTLESLSLRLVNELKTVRLRALHDSPLAFGSTFTEESKLSEADWLRRATDWNNGSTSMCRIAMNEGMPCGIVAGYMDDNAPSIPHVASMWVESAHRRTGLGTCLIDEVQRWAQGVGAGELLLTVTNINTAAIRFYERLGFVLTGKTEPYPNDPALFEYEMAKRLSNS
jgi:ribosomal protein S18 acetylase RimI-like enzyme